MRPSQLRRRPRVSVVVPLYNYGHFLPECVESIVSQENVDVDVLVIDDASTDDSLAVAEALAEREPRVRVLANGANRGMVATMNAGLWAAESEYVVKFDADDVLAPGALARAAALLDAHPSVGFVYGFPVTFTERPPASGRTRVRSWTVWDGHDWIEIRCHKGANCIYQPEVVMRTEVLHAAGPYRAQRGHAPDFDMWLRLAAIADVGRINGPDQGYYRVHPGSWQRTMNDFHLRDFDQHRQIFESLFAEHGDRIADAGRLSGIARRAIARNCLERACRAYDEGTAEQEPIDGYVALALEVWPEAADLPGWRALDRRRRQGAGPQRSARATRLRRDLEDRLRWRHWRWTGI